MTLITREFSAINLITCSTLLLYFSTTTHVANVVQKAPGTVSMLWYLLSIEFDVTGGFKYIMTNCWSLGCNIVMKRPSVVINTHNNKNCRFERVSRKWRKLLTTYINICLKRFRGSFFNYLDLFKYVVYVLSFTSFLILSRTYHWTNNIFNN